MLTPVLGSEKMEETALHRENTDINIPRFKGSSEGFLAGSVEKNLPAMQKRWV